MVAQHHSVWIRASRSFFTVEGFNVAVGDLNVCILEYQLDSLHRFLFFTVALAIDKIVCSSKVVHDVFTAKSFIYFSFEVGVLVKELLGISPAVSVPKHLLKEVLRIVDLSTHDFVVPSARSVLDDHSRSAGFAHFMSIYLIY